MNDTDLATQISELARFDPRSQRGIEGMQILARNLEGEAPIRENLLIRCDSGTLSLRAEFVAQRMLQIATNTRNPNAAVAWFRKIPAIISRGTAVGGAVKVLHGVDCGERISLSEDIVLLPYSALPPSLMRNNFIARYEPGFWNGPPQSFVLPPRAALYRAGVISVTSDGTQDVIHSPPNTWFEELTTASLLLSLTPKTVPIEAAHWFNYEDPDTELLCQFGLSWQSSDFSPLGRLTQPGTVSVDSARGMMDLYRRLSDDHRDRVKLSLQRLIRARCQIKPGDRAIDLAIALEILYMNADRDEHSYKIALRAARFLYGPGEQRHEAFRRIRRLYDMRSSMVHRGSASDKWRVGGTDVTAYDLVESVDGLCARSISLFLRQGRLPDTWREIELS